jgi:hypothetical protein
VTVDGVWIGDRIYWTLTERNYKKLRQSHWGTHLKHHCNYSMHKFFSVFPSHCRWLWVPELFPASATATLYWLIHSSTNWLHSTDWLTAAPNLSRLYLGTDPTENTVSHCYSSIVGMETCLFAKPLLSNGCCIFAHLAIVVQQQAYMPQYNTTA